MRLYLKFDVPRGGLSPSELSRVFADVQHQIVALTLLTHAEHNPDFFLRNERILNDWFRGPIVEYNLFGDRVGLFPGRDHWEDERFAEDSTMNHDIAVGRFLALQATKGKLDRLDIETGIVSIRQQSPLTFETVVRAPLRLVRRIAQNARVLYERFYFFDVERQRRILDNESTREDIIRKRIQNLDSLYDLDQKIQDPYLREQVRRHLITSVLPLDPLLADDNSQQPAKMLDAKVEEDH